MNTDNTRQGLAALQQYFCDLAGQDICLAFSGGVDSSLLSMRWQKREGGYMR